MTMQKPWSFRFNLLSLRGFGFLRQKLHHFEHFDCLASGMASQIWAE